MYQNVYLTELIPDESPPELHAVRASIRDKLIARGIPVTTNIGEAHFIIVFFTRGFIRQRTDILLNLRTLPPLGHSLVLWDHKEYMPHFHTFDILICNWCYDYELAEEMLGHYPDFHGDNVEEFHVQVRKALRYMSYGAVLRTTSFRDGKFYPGALTDLNALVDAQIEAVMDNVNPLSVEYPKTVGLVSELLEITRLIKNNHDGDGDTGFVVISGSQKTHDMTTLTKSLTTEYIQAFPSSFHGLRYHDSLSQFCPQPPLSLAQSLLAECVGIDYTDFHNEFEQYATRDLKILFIFDGISSLAELKEIRKLGDLCSQIGRGSMIILSTGLNIFRELEGDFKSLQSVFMGYVEGSECMDLGAKGWRPFCLKLNDSQLEKVINVAVWSDEGGMLIDLDGSNIAGSVKEVGEGTKELSRGRIEEALGHSKRFKLL